jgi:hypothetical protein
MAYLHTNKFIVNKYAGIEKGIVDFWKMAGRWRDVCAIFRSLAALAYLAGIYAP